jgi:hypothetical protein
MPDGQLDEAVPRVLRRDVVQIGVAGEFGEPFLQLCPEMRAV